MAVWGEAIVCGFTEPNSAVTAWMFGDPQRSVLMNPDAHEAGAGYYFSEALGRGFVVFDVAADSAFGPVVINNEAILSKTPQVTLTLHPQPVPAVAMKVSNTPDFDAVAWEPFATSKAWTLEAGEGWRTVYVLLRSGNNQTQMLSDMIYLGESVRISEISLTQATNIGTAFSAPSLPAVESPLVRLSLDWSLDSSDPAFLVYRGPQVVEADTACVGGSVLRMLGDTSPGLARGILYTLPVNKLLTAYFRLKVSTNQGSAEVARLKVRAGGQDFGPLVIKADDFAQAEQFQEFAIDFAFPSPALSADVEVWVERTGAADVVVDAVRFYGQPLSTRAPIVWGTGSTAFRGQGVLARTQDEAGVGDPFYIVGSPINVANEMPDIVTRLAAAPNSLIFKSANGDILPANAAVVVCTAGCEDATWQLSVNVPWLTVTPSYEGMIVRANAAGLPKGVYESIITVTPGPGLGATASTVAVQLLVDGAAPVAPLRPVEIKEYVYLPLATRP